MTTLLKKARLLLPSPPGRGASGEGIKIFILCLVSLLLAACGFHPRGTMVHLPERMQPVRFIGLADYHPLMRELRRQLHTAGVKLAEGDEAPASVVRLILRQEGHIFSVNGNNAAVEYEYTYTLNYHVETPPGSQARGGELETRRIVYAPGGELLGRVREGEVRERDVYSELAQRLIQRLSAL